MDGTDWPATITAAGSLVAAVGAALAVVLGYANRRAARIAAEKATVAANAAVAARDAAEESKKDIIAATEDGLVIIGRQLDGRLSELLKEARALARAEGVAQGEQAQRDRSTAPQD